MSEVQGSLTTSDKDKLSRNDMEYDRRYVVFVSSLRRRDCMCWFGISMDGVSLVSFFFSCLSFFRLFFFGMAIACLFLSLWLWYG